MTRQEYENARLRIEKTKNKFFVVISDEPSQRENLQRYFEDLITICGHGWCMDVRRERRKMARLVTRGLLKEI